MASLSSCLPPKSAVDGENDVMTGWMISDMTIDQIKTLRVRMRDDSRDRNFDLLYEIPTVQETADFMQKMVDHVHQHSHNDRYTEAEWLEARNEFVLKEGYARANTNVGLYIETKRAGFYRSLGLNLEEKLVSVLEESSFQGPIIIQSFELESLQLIRQLKPEWKTVKLLTQKDMLPYQNDADGMRRFLDGLAETCDGIGPHKRSIIPVPNDPPARSLLVDSAHDAGLIVHPFTFRSDVKHLHRVYGGNATQEFADFFKLGVDGVFADFPDHAVYARESCNYLRSIGVEYSKVYRPASV